MASLAEAIYALPTPRLRTLVQKRKLDVKRMALIPNKRQLAQFLATELMKPGSVSEAILQCNARALRLLQLLLIGENDQIVPWAEIVEAAGGQQVAAALDSVMTELETLGLAFRIGQGVLLPAAVRAYVPASLSDRYTLARCLHAYDAPAIKRIYDTLALRPAASTKAANIDVISAHLLTSSGLCLNKPLDEEEKAVLEFMAQTGGTASAVEIASTVLGGKTDDFFRYDWQNRWKQGRERNAVDRLMARGILHVVSHGYAYHLFLIIPGDLLRALAGNADHSFWNGDGPRPTPLPHPPGYTEQHETLVRDVVSLLAFITTQEAVRTNTGHMHKTALKNLARSLSLPEERYASFVYALCRDSGLITAQNDRQLYGITARGNSWLHWDALTQARILMEAWRDGSAWGEMFSEPLGKSNDYRNREGMRQMRQGVLDIVLSTNMDSFQEVASITDVLAFRAPLLLAQSVSMGDDLVASPALFVRLLLCECLYWLGLAELSYVSAPAQTANTALAGPAPTRTAARSAAARSTAAALRLSGEIGQKPALPAAEGFRLTPMGAALLGPQDVSTLSLPPREEQFILQANAEIFIPPFLAPATFYHLLCLTELPSKSSTGNTVSLTRDSIRRALDRGETAQHLSDFLQAHARTGTPQNVEYLIQEVSGRHGHIHVGKAQMYIQVNSPLLMQELEARRELKNYTIRRLSDTVAVLNAEDEDKLLRDLRKAGYLPVADGKPRTSPLSLKILPAPDPVSTTGPLPDRQAKRALKADAALDWERISQEDSKPWSQTVSETSATSNQVQSQPLIKMMLTQAVKARSCVEISYRNPDTGEESVRTIEPQQVAAEVVYAFDRLLQRFHAFPLGQIRWARLTGERFLLQ